MTSPSDEPPVIRVEKQSDTSSGMAGGSSLGWGAAGTVLVTLLGPKLRSKGISDGELLAVAGAVVTLFGAAGTWFTTYILPARLGGGRR